MSYRTKTFTVRLNTRQLDALEKLQEKNPLATRNKIVTSCIMWRASEIVEEFERVEHHNKMLIANKQKYEGIIRCLIWDTWEYYIRNNLEVRAIKGNFEEYKNGELDRIYDTTKIFIPMEGKRPMPIRRRFEL